MISSIMVYYSLFIQVKISPKRHERVQTLSTYNLLWWETCWMHLGFLPIYGFIETLLLNMALKASQQSPIRPNARRVYVCMCCYIYGRMSQVFIHIMKINRLILIVSPEADIRVSLVSDNWPLYSFFAIIKNSKVSHMK